MSSKKETEELRVFDPYGSGTFIFEMEDERLLSMKRTDRKEMKKE